MTITEEEFEFSWFTELGNNEKGELGEKLVELYLKPRIREAYDVSRTWVNYDVRFHANPVDESGHHDHNIWEADLMFRIYEPDLKILVEVKTGEYAELEREQRSVMKWIARNPKHRVLKSNVDIGVDGFSLQFAELVPRSDRMWNPVDFLESE